MKRTTKFAALLSLCMAPAMLWSTESQAVPSWARKYNVSCYMCHSGFPQRNAVGEAFQNNGYRFPGAQEEAFTKQKNVKIGNEQWSKDFPNAPFTGSFAQFNPISMTLNGNLVNYTSPQSNAVAGGAAAKKIFNWSAPNQVSLFYGGSLGDNLTFFGQIGGIGGTATAVTSSARVIYRITPGLNFAMGNAFSPAGNAAWNGVGAGGVTNVTSLLPQPTNYAELQLTQGEKGGFAILAGTSVGAAPAVTSAASTTATVSNTVDDTRYVRAKVKLIGAGMLSGANGELGDSYLGLDNQLNLGFGLSTAKNPTIFGGNYLGETVVYGGDVQGVYHNALVGVAVSRDKDLGLNNFRAEAGYFVYPWLFAKVAYSDLTTYSAATTAAPIFAAQRWHNPTIVPSVTAWIAPNVTLAATYTVFKEAWKQSPAVGTTPANYLSNQNTFRLAFQAAF